MIVLSTRFTIQDCQFNLNDVEDIPRAFSPYLVIDKTANNFLTLEHSYLNGIFNLKITSSFHHLKEAQIHISQTDELLYKKVVKHFIKNNLYFYLSNYFGIDLPYGSLTGVRPTKLYYELLDNQKDAIGILNSEYGVSHEKIKLLTKVINAQRKAYKIDNTNCDIFVNIPFCPTRCNYCSFISNEIGKVKKSIPSYIEKVTHEINQIKKMISQQHLNLRSIYIGGGTPTCIGVEHLTKILETFKDYRVEFTIEAGRPDTITTDILNAMSRYNVTRISINPQSFNDNTLKTIGRNHTVAEFYQAYKLAREYNFEINVDLIAGLEGEKYQDFCHSVDSAVALEPDNITIHSLSIKRGAQIRDRKKSFLGEVGQMIDYAHKTLEKSNYQPYYLYRQKNTADNLENTGFCKNEQICIYNIDMMEDISTILGAGAGAITKICKDNKIKRYANPKDINQYLERTIIHENISL